MPLTKKSKPSAPKFVTNKQPPPDVSVNSPLDHWSFLDEIEAPMWIDLNFEATGTLHENNDEWFQMTHQFHQCSSRQLISAFSHSSEVCTNSVSRGQEPCSPKVPSSVSKSRGKHYKNRVWTQSNCTFATKHHPMKSISSKLSGVTLENVKKVKPQLENLVKKGDMLPAGVDSENNITETAGSSTPKMTKSFRHTKFFTDATIFREGEKNSISTVTSESIERNEKLLDVAEQIRGQPSKLLSSLRTSLRKSCGTRPPTRTDINRVRRSVGTKSSSSKSSVGSSSHPDHDGNNMTARGTLCSDKTPESRNAMGIYQAPMNILKGPNVSKASPVLQKLSSGSKQKIGIAVQKSINQETLKAKIQSHPVRPKVLLPEKTYGSDRLIASRTEGKVQVSEQRKRCPGAGKEIVLETMTRKNSLARGTEVKLQMQKTTKERIPVKIDGGKQVCVKKNISCRNGRETSAGMVQKLYLR